MSSDFNTIMKWADAARRLKVRTNADSPTDSKRARSFGAEGLGLTRTEHMFFEGDRIIAMRQMILPTRCRPGEGAQETAAVSAEGFHRDLHGHEGAAGHGTPARPAACTSSFPHEKDSQKELAAAMGVR